MTTSMGLGLFMSNSSSPSTNHAVAHVVLAEFARLLLVASITYINQDLMVGPWWSALQVVPIIYCRFALSQHLSHPWVLVLK